MSERIINIQDAFLNYIRKNKVPVTVFLLNGVKISGVISCFDQSSIVVKREGYTQLVYKHAISTFSPHGPISVFDWNGPVNSQKPKYGAPQKNASEDEFEIEIEDYEEEEDFEEFEDDKEE
jgi:host factor-I protein